MLCRGSACNNRHTNCLKYPQPLYCTWSVIDSFIDCSGQKCWYQTFPVASRSISDQLWHTHIHKRPVQSGEPWLHIFIFISALVLSLLTFRNHLLPIVIIKVIYLFWFLSLLCYPAIWPKFINKYVFTCHALIQKQTHLQHHNINSTCTLSEQSLQAPTPHNRWHIYQDLIQSSKQL